jgi:hypothetical protein
VLSRSARTSSLALALVTVWMFVGISSTFAQQPARCEVDKARFTIGQPYSPELAERAPCGRRALNPKIRTWDAGDHGFARG